MSDKINNDDIIYDVIIIGAGASGLEAAKHLHNHNSNNTICILEGRDRLGGRCYTDPTFGDIGAAWIHGEKGNLLYDHHHRYRRHHHNGHDDNKDNNDSIIIIPTNYDNRIVYDLRDNQATVTSNEVLRTSEREWEYIQKTIAKLQDKGSTDISLLNGLNKAIAINTENKKLDSSNNIFLNFFKNESIDLDYACFTNDTSLWYYDDDRELEGGDYLTNIGLGASLLHMHKDFLPLYDIRLNNIVTDIAYNSNDDDIIRIATQQGGVYKCHYCICTVPLGVLKKNVISFSPPLAPSLATSLSQWDMGLLNKTILIFDEVFWDKDKTILAAVDDNSMKVWWMLNLFAVTGQSALVLFTGTENALSRESKSDDELTTDILEVLQKMYKNENIKLLNVLHTRWASDPFSYGSYSYRKVGFNPKTGTRGFQSTYYNGKLVFAGEHTSIDAYCTVHGAIESGIRAANDIITAQKK